MMERSEKVLIIRLGAIGDVVHTTNLYRAIKQSYPNVEIHYMTTKTQACFLENDPDISKVIVISKDDLKIAQSRALAGVLKKENYNLAINLQPNIKSAYLLFCAGIKKQLNYKKTFSLHAVENFYRTAKNYFKDINLPKNMTLYISEEAKNYAETEFENLPRPIIAFNAGGINSPRQGRTYPIGKWLELGLAVQEKFGGSIILTGSKEDAEALNVLQSLPNSHFYVGKTTIEQNAAIIGKCDLMISGDSGPLHIATALGVPSIGLYGSMPIERTGTYGQNCVSLKSDLKCVPCNRRKCKYLKGNDKVYAPCMEAIEVKDIISECEKYILVNK